MEIAIKQEEDSINPLEIDINAALNTLEREVAELREHLEHDDKGLACLDEVVTTTGCILAAYGELLTIIDYQGRL